MHNPSTWLFIWTSHQGVFLNTVIVEVHWKLATNLNNALIIEVFKGKKEIKQLQVLPLKLKDLLVSFILFDNTWYILDWEKNTISILHNDLWQ